MPDLNIPGGLIGNRDESLGRLNQFISGNNVSRSRYLTFRDGEGVRITRNSGERGFFTKTIPQENKILHRAAISQFLAMIEGSYGSIGRDLAGGRLEQHLRDGKALTTREAREIALQARQAFYNAQGENVRQLAWAKSSGWYYEFVKGLEDARPVGLIGDGKAEVFHGFTDGVFARVERALAQAGRRLTEEELQAVIKCAATEEHNLRAVENLVRGWSEEYPEVRAFAMDSDRLVKFVQAELKRKEGFGERPFTLDELRAVAQPTLEDYYRAHNRDLCEKEYGNRSSFQAIFEEFPKMEFSSFEMNEIKKRILDRANADPRCRERTLDRKEFNDIAYEEIVNFAMQRQKQFDGRCPELQRYLEVESENDSPFNRMRAGLAREVPEPEYRPGPRQKSLETGYDYSRAPLDDINWDRSVKAGVGQIEAFKDRMEVFEKQRTEVFNVLRELEEGYSKGFIGNPPEWVAGWCDRMLARLDNVENPKGVKMETSPWGKSPAFQALRKEIEHQKQLAKGQEAPKPLLDKGPPPEPKEGLLVPIPPNLRLIEGAPDPDQIHLGVAFELVNKHAEERLKKGDNEMDVLREAEVEKGKLVTNWKTRNLVPARSGMKKPKVQMTRETESTERRAKFGVDSYHVPEKMQVKEKEVGVEIEGGDLGKKKPRFKDEKRFDAPMKLMRQQAAMPNFRHSSSFPIYNVSDLKQDLHDTGKRIQKEMGDKGHSQDEIFTEIQKSRQEIIGQTIFHEGMKQALAKEGIVLSQEQAQSFFGGLAEANRFEFREIPEDPEERKEYERQLKEQQKLLTSLSFFIYDLTNREERPGTLIQALGEDLLRMRMDVIDELGRLGEIHDSQDWDSPGCERLGGVLTDMFKKPDGVLQDGLYQMRLDINRSSWRVGALELPFDKDVDGVKRTEEFLEALNKEILIAFPTATEEERAQLLTQLSSVMHQGVFGVLRSDQYHNPGDLTQIPLANMGNSDGTTRYEIRGEPGRLIVRAVNTQELMSLHKLEVPEGEDDQVELQPGSMVEESLQFALERDEDGARITVLGARYEMAGKPVPQPEE